jgi:predicted nuclease of predicted toxin-antitoxin system
MKLYLDEDIAGMLLVQHLKRAGHDVQVPSEVGLSGRPDPVHLTHAIRAARILLSRNYRDFELLHLLLMQAQGHHPGILIVRRDDVAKRNMAPRDIVRALHNLEAAGVSLADQYIIVNAWQ